MTALKTCKPTSSAHAGDSDGLWPTMQEEWEENWHLPNLQLFVLLCALIVSEFVMLWPLRNLPLSFSRFTCSKQNSFIYLLTHFSFLRQGPSLYSCISWNWPHPQGIHWIHKDLPLLLCLCLSASLLLCLSASLSLCLKSTSTKEKLQQAR